MTLSCCITELLLMFSLRNLALLSPNSWRQMNYSDVANKSISPLLTANPTSSNSAKL